MKNKIRKYDSYKDSGIEWIGEIPCHWEESKLKYLFSFGKGLTITKENLFDVGVPCVNYGEIHSHCAFKINPEHNLLKCVSNDYLTNSLNSLLKNGDFIFADTSEDIEGSGNFTHLYGDKSVFAGYHTIVVKPKQKLNSRFFAYHFDSLEFRSQIRSAVKGIKVLSVTQSILKNCEVWIPPFEEQTTIANYLDHKTSQIDDLIAKKERLIQLLEEERTAIINQAVTKGLDPTVPMKDSGIEWLGEIPAHWEVKRMRYLSDITTGGKDTENREDDGIYPFYVRSQTVERISTYSFDGEAILTAGDGVGVCKVWHYVNEKFDFHQRVYMLCNFRAVLGKYLFYYLKENFGKEVMKLSAKSTVDSLRRPMFQNFLVCFGTIEEQNEIILKIEKEEHRIQTITAKAQQEIELLKEYKTALISEVVTGKVDVRNEKLN